MTIEHRAAHTALLNKLETQGRQFHSGNGRERMDEATAAIGHLLLDHLIRHDLAIHSFMEGRGGTGIETRLPIAMRA